MMTSNATFDAATFAETAGTLKITGAATIHLGAGATLAFANSSSNDWSGGALDLTGTFVSGTSLRFGTIGGGLTPAQLALISINGAAAPLELDAGGYLTQTARGYAAWKTTHAPLTGDDPNADEDGDDVANGIEYLLGGTSTTNDLDKLPQVSTDGVHMIFSFVRDQASIDGVTTAEIQVGDNLTGWPTSYPVPGTAVAESPGITVEKNVPAGFDTVTLTLPLSGSTRRFARLTTTP